MSSCTIPINAVIIGKITLLVLCYTSVKLRCYLPCCGSSPVQDDLPDVRFLWCVVENMKFEVGLQVMYSQNMRSLIKDMNLKTVFRSVCSDNCTKCSSKREIGLK